MCVYVCVCVYGGSVWVVGEWAVGQWIVGVASFQKIFGLCGLKCHIVETWPYYASCGWILWVGWVCVGDGGVGSGSVDCGCHQLSENICFGPPPFGLTPFGLTPFRL